MTDILFFVKTVAICLVLILAMQIKVDQFTVEHHVQKFVRSSVVVSPIQSMAKGGAKMIQDLVRTVSNSVHKNGKDGKGLEVKSNNASSFRWFGSASTPSQNETE